LDLVTLHAS